MERPSDDKAVVTMGAVDVHDQWKGGPLFHELLKALADRNTQNHLGKPC
jgi:hypothetical protein